MHICLIVNGKRLVAAELALLFGCYIRQNQRYWLDLQHSYGIEVAAGMIAEQEQKETHLPEPGLKRALTIISTTRLGKDAIEQDVA